MSSHTGQVRRSSSTWRGGHPGGRGGRGGRGGFQHGGSHSPTLSVGPCKLFFDHGTCRFGARCKFSHDPTDRPQRTDRNGQRRRGSSRATTEANTVEHDEEREQYYRWKSSVRDATSSPLAIASWEVIRDPWSQAVAVLDADGRGWHQQLARDIVGDGAESESAHRHKLLHNTMRTKPNFQRTYCLDGVRDFLRVITHPSIVDCLSVETYVGTMYNIISGVNGDRAIHFFAGICDGIVKHETYTTAPEKTSQCFEGVIDVMYELLRRERRASLHPDLSGLLDQLDRVLGLLDTLTPHDLQRHTDRIARLRRIADLASDRLTKDTDPDDEVENAYDGYVFPLDIELLAGRHDNDHRDIAAISILPTPGEIANNEPDYLPSTDCRQPHFIDDPVQRYLDTHFRLLRHDILGPLKDTLSTLMSSIQQGIPLLKSQSKEINAYIYTDASIAHIAVDSRRGFEAHVAFTPPSQLKSKSNAEQRQWWENCKRLEPGGLVSLICLDGDRAIPLLLIVTDKSTDSNRDRGPCLTPQSYHKPTIGTKLASNSQADLLWLVKIYQGKLQGILVDLPGLIPATFMPILGNLQRMMVVGDLPFQEWIVPKRGASAGDRVLLAPQYARGRGFSFSLQSICNVAVGTPLSVGPTSSPNDMTLIDGMEARTGLDRGQCQAMVAALTREFALIQGPPGTGKSYLGVKLLQVLLDCKTKANLGPIIIICYTNHALDQFLKHLLAVGIAKIIRIGGKSRCPELDRFNLRERTAIMNKTGTERYMLGSSHSKLEEHMERMGKRLASLHKIRCDSTATAHESIKRLLQRKYPDIHDQFDRTDDEGFTKVGKDPFVVWASERDKRFGRGHPPAAVGAVGQETDVDALLRLAEVDANSLHPFGRQILMDSWLREIQTEETNMLFEDICSAESLRGTLDSVHGELNRRALLTADVIGVTTTGFARDIATLRKLRAKIIVCEEAAEVLEAHMISALMPGVEHLIQIGDHQQLRPQINNYSLSLETPQGKLYQVDRSQFERLARGEPGIPAMPVAQLNVQRRMRPQIASFIRDTMYPSLRDHTSVTTLPDVVGMRENVFWLDHQHLEDTAGDDGRLKSHSNTWEVSMTKALVRHLVRQGAYKSTDIAVLTPYTGQLQKLRASLGRDFEISLSDTDEDKLAQDGFELDNGTNTEDKDKDATKPPSFFLRKQLLESLRLATVDNFQGEEAPVVIVSLVRSNPTRKVGFLRTKNRINVLLSRAQHGLYLIGNKNTYTNIPMWSDVRKQLDAVGAVGSAFNLCCPRHADTPIACATPEDFLRNSPEGGCDLPCDRRLAACGHKCQTKCHSETMHNAFVCPQPCPRVRATCSHACRKLCGETCGLCLVLVDGVVLACGHVVDRVSCHRAQDKDMIKCQEMVDKKVSACGQVVRIQCHRNVEAKGYSCPTPCGATLPCGHQCTGTCGSCTPKKEDGSGRKDAEHQKCKKRCGRPSGTCGHTCGNECHAGEGCRPCGKRCEVQCPHSRCSQTCRDPCTPCIEPCAWACEHQGQCTMPCAAPCNRLPCNERCSLTLGCGHRCPSLCGETCPEGYCQECGHRKDDRVDLLEFKTYEEIDLDETPVVVIDCGHFFTAESLDGLVSMGEVYVADGEGGYTALLQSREMLAVPCCPDCKRPIRQFATRRFNRVVNMAVMDETSKKLLIQGQFELDGFEQRASEIEESLQKSRDKCLSLLRLATIAPAQRQRPKDIISARYAECRSLVDKVQKFCSRMGTEQQPSKKLYDAIVQAKAKAKAKQPLDSQLANLTLNDQGTQDKIPPPDKTIILNGQLPQLKVQMVMLRDRLFLMQRLPDMSATLTPAFDTPRLVADLIKGYDSLISQAVDESLIRVAVQGVIGYARVVTIIQSSRSTCLEADASLEKYVQDARTLLEGGLKLCDNTLRDSNIDELRKEMAELQKVLRRAWHEPVTEAELKSIKAAMVSGPRGISTHSGHWYKCQNGHVFAIGECGMPMQLARCPECGSPIGGQDHRYAAGVSRAQEMES